ncbi:GDSL-type esterase/lipase family protein [Asanoa sp. NPDC049518]|uniref:SGNH/GDSL hydrolase family protein n=1 Tax=unclassified Asanoa TaxID=2685164 RepID=UPI00342B5902
MSAGLVGICVVGALVATPAAAEPTPGTGTRPAAAAARAAASNGLQLKVNERGRISRSVAAVASDTAAGGTLTLRKPAGATVRRAYAAVATTGFRGTRLVEPVTVDGEPIALDNEVATGISSFNYLADVTGLLKSKLDSAAAGPVTFSVVEPQPDAVDGEIFVVVFDDPAVTVDLTVSLLYGALSPTGDEYQVELATPINRGDRNTRLEMSLGISFSYQSAGTQQFSTVDVNGQRLTSAAGGEDDGADHDGALITVGGEGDAAANPADAQTGPSEPRSDDELYDLLPFVDDSDRRVTVRTANPSLDDNILLAVFTMNPPVTGITTGAGPDYVAIGDSTTTGFSIPTCREDREESAFGCVGTPPATPYPDRIAGGFDDANRVGIWGYTIREAVRDADNGRNAKGPWRPQLLEAEEARQLVTVSLGANDIRFSDVPFWLRECLARQFTTLLRSTCNEAAKTRAEAMRPDVVKMMNRLDKARSNGAEVVILLYYNPYHIRKEAGPFNLASRDCSVLWAMAEIIIANLNRVLRQEAEKHEFTLAPLSQAFSGHGAGARDSYVFGSDCDAAGAASAVKFNLGWPPVNTGDSEKEIHKRFDPHPNGKGTQTQANQVTTAVKP